MHRCLLPLHRSAARAALQPALTPSAAIGACARLHSRAASHASAAVATPAAAAAPSPSTLAAARGKASSSSVATARGPGGALTQLTAVTRAKPTKRGWHLFDARDQVVGRLAARIATLLQGKHRPDYTAHLDHGDCVVVLNARHLHFTGNKWQKKLYRYHTGYIGGLKEIPAERWREAHPERILRHAVAGMLRKNKLKVPRLARLKIYPGLLHPHQAQFPEDVIGAVPHLKAQRDAELAQLANQRAYAAAITQLASSGGKVQLPTLEEGAKEKKAAELIQGPDDGTMPTDPDIKKAILKDREERKGRPIVML